MGSQCNETRSRSQGSCPFVVIVKVLEIEIRHRTERKCLSMHESNWRRRIRSVGAQSRSTGSRSASQNFQPIEIQEQILNKAQPSHFELAQLMFLAKQK